MTTKKPLKRNSALKPFSKDHHHGLLLSWKIRAGIKKNVDPHRIGNYVTWFYENHLKPHFGLEEKFMFPILGTQDELVGKALADHLKLTTLISSAIEVGTLNDIAVTLEAHIRFEERILFEKIQSVATEVELAEIERIHNDAPFVEHSDEFWK